MVKPPRLLKFQAYPPLLWYCGNVCGERAMARIMVNNLLCCRIVLRLNLTTRVPENMNQLATRVAWHTQSSKVTNSVRNELFIYDTIQLTNLCTFILCEFWTSFIVSVSVGRVLLSPFALSLFFSFISSVFFPFIFTFFFVHLCTYYQLSIRWIS